MADDPLDRPPAADDANPVGTPDAPAAPDPASVPRTDTAGAAAVAIAAEHAAPPVQPHRPAVTPALARLADAIRAAQSGGTPLVLRGHGSKDFYGHASSGQVLSTLECAGVSAYEPSELVVTVRAGTPLAELEAALAEQGQCLAFEPPRLAGARAGTGTVGGMVAAALAGPGRLAAGSVRDFVLGATIVNGRGQVLTFGGQVMKNVAGYDVSRLMAGAMGTLGLIAEVSIKVLPQPAARRTLRLEMDEAAALQQLNVWGGQPLPISATAWWDGILVVRLAGAQAAVATAATRMGGETVDADMADGFWQGLRDQADEFFNGAQAAVKGGAASLWRLSVPQTAPSIALSGEQLIEWGGAQRWWCTPARAAAVREAAAALGGHATLMRSGSGSGSQDAAIAAQAGGQADSTGIGAAARSDPHGSRTARTPSSGDTIQVGTPDAFHPLAPAQQRLHRALKAAFDPAGILNPGRLFTDAAAPAAPTRAPASIPRPT